MSVQTEKALNTSLLTGHILLLSCHPVLILLGIQSNGDLRLNRLNSKAIRHQDCLAIVRNFSNLTILC